MTSAHPESTSLSGCRVLVVEDEYFIADDIAGALRRHGAEVVGPAADVDEARDLLASSEPLDMAVLDINLQGEMVFSFAEGLRDRGVPFVFATGYAQASVPLAFAAVPRWEKPYQYEALVRALPALTRGA